MSIFPVLLITENCNYDLMREIRLPLSHTLHTYLHIYLSHSLPTSLSISQTPYLPISHTPTNLPLTYIDSLIHTEPLPLNHSLHSLHYDEHIFRFLPLPLSN